MNPIHKVAAGQACSWSLTTREARVVTRRAWAYTCPDCGHTAAVTGRSSRKRAKDALYKHRLTH